MTYFTTVLPTTNSHVVELLTCLDFRTAKKARQFFTVGKVSVQNHRGMIRSIDND